MTGPPGRRLVYWATGVSVLALTAGFVMAASTLNAGPSQSSNATTTNPSPFSGASVVASALLVETPTIAAYGTLGVQSGSTAGLSGTTSVLATCASGPCQISYAPASQTNPATSLDYAEEVEIAVTQPTTGVGASGFDLQITVSFGAGSLAIAAGYASTGTTSAGSPQTVDVFLYVDLGTASAPTVNVVSVTFNTCGSTASCP